MQVALITCAIQRSTNDREQAGRFAAQASRVFQVEEDAPGLIARAVRSDGDEVLESDPGDWGPWGAYAVPDLSLTAAKEPCGAAQTLSVWKDYAGVRSFAYERLHRPASRGANSFLQCPWPNYCLWWIEPGHQVTWTEATSRLDYFHEQGDTPVAFTFHLPFDARARVIDGA
ncbi:DUF3291 domain-containing protein [Leucobacter sp.]